MKAFYSSPLGTIEISASEEGITAARFLNEDVLPLPASDAHPVLEEGVRQLDEYFRGERAAFSLPLQLAGTEFQVRVWQELRRIPFGVTRSYLDIAEALGDRNAVRAVGAANGQNPIAVIVPCHRVIGSDGSLTGYGGGLWRKEWLLAHEGHPAQQRLFE